MSGIYQVCDFITEYIFDQELLSLERINQDFLRNALYELNCDIKTPHPAVFRGQWCAQYLSACSLQTMNGVKQWVTFIQAIQDDHYSLSILSWEILGVYERKFKTSYGTWLVPALRITQGPATLSVETLFVNVNEYMQMNHLTTLHDFIKDVIEILLYGAPMREGIMGPNGLNLEDVGAYAASRLFQGVVEVLIEPHLTWLPSFTSVFIDDAMTRLIQKYMNDEDAISDKVDSMNNSLQRYIREDTGKRMKLENDLEGLAAEVLTATHWMLGNNEDIVLEIANKFKFGGRVQQYAEYVRRAKIGQTLGYTVWNGIATGANRFADDAVSGQGGEQTGDAWWNKIISTSVTL